MFLDRSQAVRLGTLTALYFAQGVPIGLFSMAMPAWMASRGIDAVEIAAFMSVVGLPWSFKLFSGIFMDRFPFPAMGQRRPWVLIAQLGLVITYVAGVGLMQSGPEMFLLTVLAFTANAFAAMQDVAVDGMAIVVVPEEERGRANSFMVFGQVLGTSVFAGVSGWLLKDHGVSLTLASAAVVILLIWLWVLLVRSLNCRKTLISKKGTCAS